MRKESLDRVTGSMDRLLANTDELTRLFYDQLFATAPDTRSLFRVDMAVQRRHFAAALTIIIKNLTMLDVLAEPLRELGVNHAAIGVRPQHYPIVRDAMLHAMGQVLGEDWTPELQSDWAELLGQVSQIMMTAGTRLLRQP